MKKVKRNTSLKNKIIFLIIMISMYPILLIGFFGAYNYENLIKNRFISYSQKDMNVIANYIRRDVKNMNELIGSLLSDQGFYELTSSKPIDDSNAIKNYSFKRDMEDYLRAVIYSNKDFDVAGFCFEQDDLLIYVAQEKGMVSPNHLPLETIADLVEDNVSTQFYVEEINDDVNIYFAKKVLHKDTFHTIGYIFFRLEPDYLTQLLSQSYKEVAETIYIYTEKGILISKAGFNQDNSMLVNKEYYAKDEGVYIEKGKTTTYYIVTKKIEQLNMTVITVISNELLTSDLRKITDLILILCALIMPLSILIGYFLFKNIAKPIKDLTDKMLLFEEGKPLHMVVLKRNDEIGFLYKAFIRMTQSIRTLIKDVYEKELARKDAEIAALQEQINPHFLYNTLESINWRAQLAGQNDIALMIQSLSKLMEAGINRNNEKYTTLEQELFYMEQYMYLVQMRYDYGIEYVKQIDEETLQYKIPRLILQPLLENAIKHGIEPVGEGRILLQTYKSEEKWVIVIEDNGAGMPTSKLNYIKRICESEKKIIHNDGRKSSIGFQNVARRLHLIYDNHAEIHITSQPEVGTRITLTIPILEEQEDQDESLSNSDY